MIHDKITIFQELKKLIQTANNILLISHKKPDGDTLGGVCAIRLLLQNLKKNTISACIDDIPANLNFLPEIKHTQKSFELSKQDLIIVIDCGASYMSRYHEIYPNIFDGTIPVINIDHHPSNDNFGKINLVDTNAASSTVIIYEFMKWLKINITKEIATCLLTGIYNDTGSLMHSNTTAEVYKISSELLQKGANLRLIVKNLFKNTPINTLKLWGRALNNIKTNNQGVTISVVTEKDFKETDTDPEALSGIIDYVNSIPNAKFSVLLSEDNEGHVKGSFRTQQEDVNLSKIAGVFGGGGHKKAAGFTIPGRLEKEVKWKIVEK